MDLAGLVRSRIHHDRSLLERRVAEHRLHTKRKTAGGASQTLFARLVRLCHESAAISAWMQCAAFLLTLPHPESDLAWFPVLRDGARVEIALNVKSLQELFAASFRHRADSLEKWMAALPADRRTWRQVVPVAPDATDLEFVVLQHARAEAVVELVEMLKDTAQDFELVRPESKAQSGGFAERVPPQVRSGWQTWKDEQAGRACAPFWQIASRSDKRRREARSEK